MICQFCLRSVENEDTREILDKETLLTIQVCEDCAEETGAIDEVIDNQIEDRKLQTLGIPI